MIRFRSLLSAGAACVAVAIAACETPAPPPPPAPPPAPPPPPAISLNRSVLESASLYQQYISRASAIPSVYPNGPAIGQALATGAAFQPAELARGSVAYAAVVALQDPTFVAAVRKYADDPEQRRMIAARLIAEPSYAVGIRGSDSAAGLILAALNSQAQSVGATGKRVKQMAYDIQHQKWSREDIPLREKRLAEIKAASLKTAAAPETDVAFLQQASLGSASMGLTGAAATPPYTPTVARGLALAALAALGEAEANPQGVEQLLNEPSNVACLNMSKLNLFQCLAVAKPHYEDVFCLGEHILLDTSQCIGKAAGQTPAPVVLPVAVTTLPPAPAAAPAGAAPATPATTAPVTASTPQASTTVGAALASSPALTQAASAPSTK